MDEKDPLTELVIGAVIEFPKIMGRGCWLIPVFFGDS
jgi:hypothetical protein